jgi:hypothetical protein
MDDWMCGCDQCNNKAEPPEEWEEIRPYTDGTQGRTDVDGVVWFACDPYPTWYRWENSVLYTADPVWPRRKGEPYYGEEDD